jgi:hypothetical protein
MLTPSPFIISCQSNYISPEYKTRSCQIEFCEPPRNQAFDSVVHSLDTAPEITRRSVEAVRHISAHFSNVRGPPSCRSCDRPHTFALCRVARLHLDFRHRQRSIIEFQFAAWPGARTRLILLAAVQDADKRWCCSLQMPESERESERETIVSKNHHTNWRRSLIEGGRVFRRLRRDEVTAGELGPLWVSTSLVENFRPGHYCNQPAAPALGLGTSRCGDSLLGQLALLASFTAR